MSLTHTQAAFDQLYVTQRFAAPVARPTLTAPDPNAPTTVSLSAALRSTTRLAVLGDPGSGRTTLLNKLARVYADKQAVTTFGLKSERLPVVLHFAEIDWPTSDDGDPLSSLLHGATAHVPRLISANVSNLIRNRLRGNSAVLLVDGFDELAPGWRPRAAQWLAALIAQFPDLPIVVTAGPLGYGALQNSGFVPLTLAAWTTAEHRSVRAAVDHVDRRRRARSRRPGRGSAPIR